MSASPLGKRMNVFLVSSLGKVVSRSGVYVQVNEHRKNNFNNEWTKKTFMRLPCASPRFDLQGYKFL
jgi:hypothetical protein